jgi:hypothetical protein
LRRAPKTRQGVAISRDAARHGRAPQVGAVEAVLGPLDQAALWLCLMR